MTTANIMITLLLAFGVLQVVYGSLLLFSPKFYHHMEAKVWKENYEDEQDAKQGLIYNKYTRGITSLCLGIFIVGMIIHGTFF